MPISRKTKTAVKSANATRAATAPISPDARHEFDRWLGRAPTALPVLGSTALKCRESCERHWLLQEVYGLRPVARSQGRDEGSYLHHAAPVILSHEQSGDSASAVAAANAATRVLQQRVLADLAEHRGDDPDPTETPDVFQEHARAMGLAMAVRLIRELKPHLDAGNLRVVAVERSFSVPASILWRSLTGDALPAYLADVPVPVQIDLIVADPEGRHYLLDFKSEGESPAEAIKGYRYSAQAELYTRVVRLCEPSWDVAGFLHYVIKKPGIRRKGMKTLHPEPLSDYVARCNDFWDARGDHLHRAGDERRDPPVLVHLQRIEKAAPPAFIRRVRDYLAAVHEAESAPRDEYHYPEREASCRHGNMQCDFRPICTASRVEWQAIASRRYTTAPDPLDSVSNRRRPR